MTPQVFRALRLSLGATQAELATLLDVQQGTISRWETSRHAIQHERLLALAMEALMTRAALTRTADILDPQPGHQGWLGHDAIRTAHALNGGAAE